MDKAEDNVLSTLDKDELLAYLLRQNEFLELKNASLARDNAALTKDLVKTQKESLHWR